jgi:osmotically-inducible protein OsmY
MKTDVELQRDVVDELEWEPGIDAAQIGVAVKHGVVTLSGHVASLPQKLTAERLAKRISGVRAVADELLVRLEGIEDRTDTDIAAAAIQALEWDALVPKDRIQVTVRAGHITLDGNVDWHFQREAAANAVCTLLGVTGVSNLITIKKRAKSGEVKSKIEAAFRRSADVDAGRINIEVHDGTVVLTGKVPTLKEREEAERATWSAPGVTNVQNQLVVG